MRILLASLLLAIVLASSVVPQSPPPPLATITLTAGWATYGQVLPPGKAKESLVLEGLTTQVDIKNRWPDGSIKYAIVTAKVPADGAYPLRAAPVSAGKFPDPAPVLQDLFALVHDTTFGPYVVGYGHSWAEPEAWLDGPLVRERRAAVPLWNEQGQYHPFLRGVVDVRQYADGTARYDLTLENCYEQWGDACSYNAYLQLNGETIWHKMNVDHHWQTRWRKTVTLGPTPLSWVTHDFGPFVAAKAVPKYSPTVSSEIDWSWEGGQFDILQPGLIHTYMPEAGGRPDIGPFPNWDAKFLVHQLPPQKETILKTADLAGSFPVHLCDWEGGYISLDLWPDYWQDHRASPPNGPGGNWGGIGPFAPDLAHQPSLAYVAYLVTGDRYYTDEMAYWSCSNLAKCWPDYRSGELGGDAGKGIVWIAAGEIRAAGWTIRSLADTAAYLPDSDPRKAYLITKLRNNLAWIGTFASTNKGAYNCAWLGVGEIDGATAGQLGSIGWQHCFCAWAIHRANGHGFTQGAAFKNQHAQFVTGWLNSPHRGAAVPYRQILSYGPVPPNPWLTTYAEASSWMGDVQHDLFYGPDARLMTIITNNTTARNYITNYPASATGPGMQERLKNVSPGWFVVP